MSDQIISKDGYEKLQEEYEDLTKNKRREIADRIQKAKDMGDLSENAEYSEAKDAQALNEGRIIEVGNLLKTLTVVDGCKKNEVSLGSKLTVKSDGKEKIFEIVSFNEVDPAEGKISNESPIGRAFLGKSKGDTVEVETPRGLTKYKITKLA
ncbi:transcription elongation factor GreA [Candidatus Parcubacteria bacterium]|nr:MAG: transcription elongation factor GreA [Candidatus Parcubacteria bacterium]